jgi:E3 ubiquitin-protein ligase HUWE1
MYCAPTFSHGRNSAAVLAAFVSAQGDQALAGLGQLHRCVKRSIVVGYMFVVNTIILEKNH